MLGMKNHFDISDSIKICEVDIAGVACMCEGTSHLYTLLSTRKKHITILLSLEARAFSSGS